MEKKSQGKKFVQSIDVAAHHLDCRITKLHQNYTYHQLNFACILIIYTTQQLLEHLFKS